LFTASSAFSTTSGRSCESRLIVRQKPVQTFCALIPLPHFREADGLTHAIACFAHD
jgi:hypothetical protein